jgi:hemin uptake protein HemP
MERNMFAATLPSPQIEVSRRRLSLRHVTVVRSPDLRREAVNSTALRTESILAPQTTPQRVTAEPVEPSTLNTETLFKGRSSLQILHKGEAYTLTITSNGKLILTK